MTRFNLSKSSVVITLLLSLAMLTPLWAQSEAEVGLVGRWKMIEGGGSVAYDSSTLANNGAASGDFYFTSDPLLEGAIMINAASGAVKVPHNASLEPVVGTLQAWVQPKGQQTADIIVKTTDRLVRSNQSGIYAVYQLRITAKGEALACIANDANSIPIWTCVVSRASLLKGGRWSLLAMRWNGQMLSLFVNGKLEAAKAYVAVPSTGLSYHGTSTLGMAVATLQSTEFIGKMSDVRLYNRARLDSEILIVRVQKR